MRHVIIHCPTSSEDRKQGWYGTTWLLSNSEVRGCVDVKFSTCSPEDQFSKSKGVKYAEASYSEIVRKAELIEYVQTTHEGNGLYCVPDVEQLYMAIIKL